MEHKKLHLVIDTIRYLQFLLFRTKMSFRMALTFYIYHKLAKVIYFYKNFSTISIHKTLSLKYHYNGHTSFSTNETSKIAKLIVLKIKKLESEKKNTFWNENGRPVLTGIGKVFPEIYKLFNGELGDVIKKIYGSDFKIFYAIMSKNIGSNQLRTGSQLWHNDGGPGRCINI